MKILRSPFVILAVIWCVAVVLVPVALAQDSGTTGLSVRAGSEQGTGTMPQPPSGGMGHGMGPGGAGNMTDSEQSFGNTGDSSTDGSPGNRHGSGNMTPSDFGNMTGFGGPGSGNMTPSDFGNQSAGAMNRSADGPMGMGDGNMTRPAFGNQSVGNMTFPGDGMSGDHNRNMTSPDSRALNGTNRTGSGNAPGWHGDGNMTPAANGQDQNRTGQQASGTGSTIFSRIQSFLASLFGI